MISHDVFAQVFGLGEDSQGNLPAIARSACRAGLAIVPVAPNDKNPICTLNTRDAHAADLAIREQTGNPKAKHVCGTAHAITDPAEAHRVFTRLMRNRPGLNIGVEVGKSRLLLVDCDTLEELEGFRRAWAGELEHGVVSNLTPTVLTPGKQADDGTWVHKDGGHFWFTLPEGVDFDGLEGPAVKNEDSGWVIYWRDRQALVPPSRRPEGPYVLAGVLQPAPAFLTDLVIMQAEAHALRRAAQLQRAADKAAHDGTDPIDSWAQSFPWAVMLEADGWIHTGKPSRCSCDEWTRPGGDAANPKSATAHEPGCTLTETSNGHGPLHIWSDNAPEWLQGRKNVSKLQYVALRDHGGSIAHAMGALNIAPLEDNTAGFALLQDLAQAMVGRESSDKEDHTVSDPGSSPDSFDELLDEDPCGIVDLTLWLDGEPPPGPQPSILSRIDDRELFYPGTLNVLFGEPEHGKSWVALAACADVLAEGGTALYCDLDGNGAPSLIERLEVLGCDWKTCVKEGRLTLATPDAKEKFTALLKHAIVNQFGMVVIDSVGEAMPLIGLKTESNDESTTFMQMLTFLTRVGICVLLIDHVTKNPENRNGWAIGAAAKKRRTDGAYIEVTIKEVFTRGKGGSCLLTVRKDRHGHVQAAADVDRGWGVFRLTAGVEGFSVELTGVSDSRAEAAIRVVDGDRVKVSSYLEKTRVKAEKLGRVDYGVSTSHIKQANIGVGGPKILACLEALEEGGYVASEPGPRNANLWKSIKKYVPLEEELGGSL